MSNNKISGSYILQSTKFAEYTFTGNDRDAELLLLPQELNFIDLSNGTISGRTVDFMTKNKIHVKGIRIVTPGGAELRACKNAASIEFSLYTDSSPLVTMIDVSRYNEWQKIDDYWEPYKLTKAETFHFRLSAGLLNIDDYNINPAYIGKKVSFYIELDIDTAGILLNGRVI